MRKMQNTHLPTRQPQGLSSMDRRTYLAARLAGAILALSAGCALAPVNADAGSARTLSRSAEVSQTGQTLRLAGDGVSATAE
jgi:hypothetical protein